MKAKNILFICAPNLGILDNLLPIIWHLKKRRPDNSFIFVIPRSRSVDEIDSENLLFTLSRDIFDGVVFQSWFGRWLFVNNFVEAKQLNRRNFFTNFIYKVMKTFDRIGLEKIYLLLTNLYSCLFYNKKNYWNLLEESKQTDLVLYDVYVHCKRYCADLMSALKDVKKYSLSHGINLRIELIDDITYKIPEEETKNITAYLYSEQEREYHKSVYGLSDSNLQIVGVPRHSISWINFLLKHEVEVNEQIREGFIFLISRPVTTWFLPRERKRKSLVAIKRLGQDLNKKIIVKLHPKERMEGLYEEVFEKSFYGDKWCYSNIHPFILGKKSVFAISFFSGVPVDMIVLDVPTIELLDLRGISRYDNKDALRDQNGDPVLTFRYHGLVLGANDYEDLKLQAERILQDRATIQKQLLDKYYKMFAKIKDPTIIADEIANS